MSEHALSDLQHAALARRLLKACGTLEEAALACRYSVAQLSRCQTAGSGSYLTADVIADLELYCGQNHYSRALVDARPTSQQIGDLLHDICRAAEDATALQSTTRRALEAAADGKLPQRICEALLKLHAAVTDEVRQAGEDLASICPRGAR